LTKFNSNGETLIFKEIPNTHEIEGVMFGIFREDGTKLGETFCRNDKFNGLAWYLDDIFIEPEYQGNNYGSQLLEKTCEALWQKKKKLDIILERPSNAIAPNGFDRKAWYERHGFTPHSNPEITYMWREPPS
jgi:GNAT superfamily N-acetyltransferase